MRFRLSDNGRYAYRIGIGVRGFWLGRTREAVGVVEARCKKNSFLSGTRLKSPTPGEPDYEREILDFACWKVHNYERRELDLPSDDLFVQDYLGIELVRSN